MRVVGLVFLFALGGCAVHHADPRVAKLQAALEKERGAAFSEQVTVRQTTRASYAARVAELLDLYLPPDATARDAAVLRAVGLIAPETDLRAHAAAPAGEQVGAYYEPERREIHLLPRGERTSPLDDSALRHELAHALEDQVTGLPRRVAALSRPGTDDLDQTVAGELLSEGGATCLARGYLHLGRPPAVRREELVQALAAGRRRRRATARLPLLLQRLPRDLYGLGALLVHDLLQAAGWAGFTRLARGRLTAEQLLHPEKLGEPPIAVTLPSLPLPRGWICVGQDTLGEYYLRLLLEELAGAPQDEACADWGGDRLAVYRAREQLAFVWRLDWDTAAAAERFAVALGRLRGASRSKVMRTAQVDRRGRTVVILGGVPAEARAQVGRVAWGDAGRR